MSSPGPSVGLYQHRAALPVTTTTANTQLGTFPSRNSGREPSSRVVQFETELKAAAVSDASHTGKKQKRADSNKVDDSSKAMDLVCPSRHNPLPDEVFSSTTAKHTQSSQLQIGQL